MLGRIATVVVTLAIVSGCAHHDRPATRTLSHHKCDTNVFAPQCRVTVVEDREGPHTCELGRFRVEPDLLELEGRKPAYIRWTLADPAKHHFCPSQGDGIELKSDSVADHRNVFESYASDNEDGARLAIKIGPACKPHSNWNWSNAEPSRKYAYKIQFRDKDGRSCIIDPWILNGR